MTATAPPRQTWEQQILVELMHQHLPPYQKGKPHLGTADVERVVAEVLEREHLRKRNHFTSQDIGNIVRQVLHDERLLCHSPDRDCEECAAEAAYQESVPEASSKTAERYAEPKWSDTGEVYTYETAVHSGYTHAVREARDLRADAERWHEDRDKAVEREAVLSARCESLEAWLLTEQRAGGDLRAECAALTRERDEATERNCRQKAMLQHAARSRWDAEQHEIKAKYDLRAFRQAARALCDELWLTWGYTDPERNPGRVIPDGRVRMLQELTDTLRSLLSEEGAAP